MTNKVRSIRMKRGLTQKQLSMLTGIGQSTISNIETGRYIPRVDIAIYIAQELHMPVERIFTVERKIERNGR